MRKFLSAILVLFLVVTPKAKADDLREFLLSCGYGTLIGATIGFGTVAFSDNPEGKTANIAKGASLGLYFGIGMGLYSINKSNSYQTKSIPSVFLMPVFDHLKQLDGASLNTIVVNF